MSSILLIYWSTAFFLLWLFGETYKNTGVVDVCPFRPSVPSSNTDYGFEPLLRWELFFRVFILLIIIVRSQILNVDVVNAPIKGPLGI
jgi:hypothetical protein